LERFLHRLAAPSFIHRRCTRVARRPG
jgi:hypothetical protein